MRYGEIVQLGRHRLMCGDASSVEDVAALLDGARVDVVLTDPPYGINIQRKNGAIGGGSKVKILKGKYYLSAREHVPMLGDGNTNAARKNYEIVRQLTDKLIIWGGSFMTDFLPISGGWIFWDKNRRGTNFSDGELAWRSWGNAIKYYKQTWNGVCMAGNYKLNGRKGKSRLHPTQKPVELLGHILDDLCKDSEVVLDCFGGSGSTLIACEVTGRTCYMMELSEYYCDVIRERYYTLKEDYALE